MKINILGYALIILIVIVMIRIYKESDYLNLKCIISNKDGKRYCVRERAKLELAADRLADVNIKMSQLVKHVKQKYPERDNVRRLVKSYKIRRVNGDC